MSDREKKGTAGATRLARLFPDHPLEKERLAFESEGLARTLAELAWNPENQTPFTVVVRGGWGRGKTTLMRRAQWMLENDEKLQPGPPEGVRDVRTLWFNAWKYPDDDTVLAGLLGAAIDRLAEGDKLDQLKRLVASYKSWTLKALFALAAPAALRELITEGGVDRFAPVHEKRAFHDTFRKLFNEVSRLMFDFEPVFRDTGGLREDQLWSPKHQEREVLAVFLDDLDRCRRERVVEVIEAINLFLDLPGVCFFLGIDWERLVDVLPQTVRDQADPFLEKVVQVAFDLPEVDDAGAADYARTVIEGSHLAIVLHDGSVQATEDLQSIANALSNRHPRHIKRFLNDLSIRIRVLHNSGKLGPGEDLLSEEILVAWRLLEEVLSPDEWRQARLQPGNLVDALNKQYRLHEDAARVREEGAEADGEARRAITQKVLPRRFLDLLRGLSPKQRFLLVHLATPPAVEVGRGRRRSGKLDLFDLESPAWIEIPGGTFPMGAERGNDKDAEADESPVHKVTISDLRIARHPVTNADYAAYVEATGKEPPEHWKEGRVPEGKERHPVVYVSWKDAMAYCQWFTQRLGPLKENHVVRLPTEAEWEYTARGEEARRYPWGNEPEPTKELANFGGNVGDTTPVGSYPDGATPEGVEDLAGNVWEWCLDGPRSYSEDEETNPRGPEGTSRVLRGGSFLYLPRDLRAACRLRYPPEYRNVGLGFRLLLGVSGGLEP